MVTVVKQSSFEDLMETLTPAKVRDGWCHSDQIFYCDGLGYGITDAGATVCLGRAGDIELYMRTGIARGLAKEVLEILDGIKESEMEGKESDDQARSIPDTKRCYQPGNRKACSKRGGLDLDARHRTPNIRRTARKGFPLRVS